MATYVSAILTICYDFSKCGNFHGFFSGQYSSTQVALEKFKTAFQAERQNCLCLQNARFQNWLAPKSDRLNPG
jgi:hypothetical protein